LRKSAAYLPNSCPAFIHLHHASLDQLHCRAGNAPSGSFSTRRIGQDPDRQRATNRRASPSPDQTEHRGVDEHAAQECFGLSGS
jgi:hypothetical protein